MCLILISIKIKIWIKIYISHIIRQKFKSMETQEDCTIRRGQSIRRYQNDFKSDGHTSTCK